MEKIDIKKLVSVNEYAKMRGVTRHTIYNWIKDGYDSGGHVIVSVVIAGKTFIQP
jgi:DNA invertase Pin-like site-specific DNA recombinase